MRALPSALLVVVASAVAGCDAVNDSLAGRPSDHGPASPAAVANAPLTKVQWKPLVAKGDAAALIAKEASAARAEGRKVLVYAGAKWCEPCQHFHHSVDAGKLDSVFGDVTFLAFDVDESREALFAAGYRSTYIPLFVVPGDDGRATAARSEGGIKGDGATDDLVAKLRRLLSKG